MRHIKSTALLALFVLATAAPAVADSLKDENLLVGLPDGFKVGDQARQGPLDMAEYVPNGETVDDWSRMITIQIAHDRPNDDPEAFAQNVAAGWQQACPGGQAAKITDTNEHGYNVSVWSYNCPLNPATGKPENMWQKAISGADAFYTVQYAYRVGLSDELPGPALTYLGQVAVCDTRKPDRACPAGM